MKFLFFEFDFAPPHETVNEDCERKNFLIAGRILPNFSRKLRSNSIGMYALLMAMMSLFLFSCDDPGQTMDDMAVSDEWKSMPDLSTLSKEELVEYFEEYKFGERGSPPVSIEITDVEGLPATPKIKTRNSAKCDVEITLIGGPPSSTDSAIVEIYENDLLIDSYTLYNEVKILVEIDDANEYKYKVIPLGDTSNPYLTLRVGLKYGTKWIYTGITDVFTTYVETYTCPESTGGMCDIEWEIIRHSGTATSYHILLLPEDGPLYELVTGNFLLGDPPLPRTVNSNFSYTLYITPTGGGPNEFFTFRTTTPYLNVSMNFNLDMTDPNNRAVVPNFDYYDCP